MAREFDGKVAVVTGATSGIGRVTAIAFAREGAKVVVSGIVDSDGQETVRTITDAGGEAIYVHADVSKPGDVEALMAKAVETYGRLDFAYNNAGIEGSQAPIADYDVDDWNRIIAINLTGVWLCTRAAIPHMLENGGGAIVNCSSIAGMVGIPGMSAYVASKHGVVGLTKSAALEYATQGIRVNAVCPGGVHTEMVDRVLQNTPGMADQINSMQPMGRIATPEEIADAVLWLCSDKSSFVTGHALVIDGGLVAQ